MQFGKSRPEVFRGECCQVEFLINKLQTLAAILYDGEEKIYLILEVVICRPFAHLNCFKDAIDRGILKTVPGKFLRCHLHQPFAFLERQFVKAWKWHSYLSYLYACLSDFRMLIVIDHIVRPISLILSI